MADTAQAASKQKCDSVLQFPFLEDHETITFIKRSKVMIIIRGLPGSGKSYLAHEIGKIYNNCAICCADNFRPSDIKYPFPKDILATSHKRCQDIAEKAAKDGVNVIVVDNSNLRSWEIQPYLNLAKEYNYAEVVVEPKTLWRWNPVELAAKSTQGVPQDVIQDKLKKKEHVYPFFYAWFVNETGSNSLRQEAEQMYDECLLNPEFVEEFLQHVVPGAPRKEDGSVDLKHYFSAETFDTGPLVLHCTAFYCDHGAVNGSKKYATKPAVEHSLGKAYKIKLIGLLITPRSFGFRLKLNEKDILLWNNDDDGNIPTPPPTTSTDDLQKDMEQLAVDQKGQPHCSSWHPSKFSPTCGPGSRAHLSIGVGVGFKAVQTGIDLVELVQDELNATAKGKDDFLTIRMKKATARCYGNGNWLVYFDESRTIDTLYTGYY